MEQNDDGVADAAAAASDERDRPRAEAETASHADEEENAGKMMRVAERVGEGVDLNRRELQFPPFNRHNED